MCGWFQINTFFVSIVLLKAISLYCHILYCHFIWYFLISFSNLDSVSWGSVFFLYLVTSHYHTFAKGTILASSLASILNFVHYRLWIPHSNRYSQSLSVFPHKMFILAYVVLLDKWGCWKFEIHVFSKPCV